MSLDMSGFIDETFESLEAVQVTTTGGDYVEGIWVDGVETRDTYSVNLQPLTDREINTLEIGNERINDYRKIYINDGEYRNLSPAAMWEFDANGVGVETYKAINTDVRVWRNYAKIIVVKEDL